MDLTIAHLRQFFWILNVRDLVRKVLHNCVVCIRYARSKKPPIKGDLPLERVKPSKSSTHVGVDFAGPFELRKSKRANKSEKVYLCLFVCFATKAIHLEIVTSLSTPDFIACLRRFIARRGLPSDFFSDNGTNFVGASNELRKLLEFVKTENVKNFVAENKCKWIFIPPSSPHFGGLWEAGVKSAKSHLRKIVGSTPLSLEALNTDPRDSNTLTPGHFLTGAPLLAIPDDCTNNMLGHTKRWELVQKLVHTFWRRWQTEYIANLQPRTKWFNNSSEIFKVNDVVLVTEHCNPANWPIAKIVKLDAGNDNVVRVVSILRNGKTFLRPVVKLRRLPTRDEN